MAPTPIPIREASTFLHSIKHSPSEYNKFKDDTRWKQWHPHLKATANSHGITNILDPAYIPLMDSAKELFLVQQTFMYSVFEHCMHTNKLKPIWPTVSHRLRKLKCPSWPCKLEVPQTFPGMDSIISFLHMQKYKITPSPKPQLKSKPMFMNKVVVLAAPLEEDKVPELVVVLEPAVELLKSYSLYCCFY
jgi:hypothetical protein